jgi:hypothetical protein
MKEFHQQLDKENSVHMVMAHKGSLAQLVLVKEELHKIWKKKSTMIKV